jgi:hypothetical protein
MPAKEVPVPSDGIACEPSGRAAVRPAQEYRPHLIDYGANCNELLHYQIS